MPYMPKDEPMFSLSFLDISLDTANRFYTWGWKASLVGATVTLIGVGLLMWGTRVRDHDFEAKMAQLNINAANAISESANASERAANVEKQNIELQTILERERSARLKLEAQIAPRSLSSPQRDALVKYLIEAAKPLNVNVILIGDREAELYGNQIASALQEAKVHFQLNHVGIMSPPPYGIQITLQPNSTKSISFKNAFEKASVPAIVASGNIGQFDAQILIGLKPIK